ncbi:MAG: ATP-binding protein, partial [Candidatus Micrarchaeota archaeon]|nr:ATP-binding protein [Candidatus Micrarchaeota archaeon]
IKDLATGIHLFSLSGMRSAESQLIYIGELLSRLYIQMKSNAKESGINCYVMIDEAQFLMEESSGSNAIIGKLIEEGRKYGFAVIMVSHASSTLNRQIVANAATFITFYSREPAEVSYSAKVLAGGDSGRAEVIKSRMRSLRQSEAMVVSGTMRDPVLVSTPRFDTLPTIGKDSQSESKALEYANHPIKDNEMTKLVSQQVIDGLIKEGKMDKFTTNLDGAVETFYMRHNKSLSIEHEVCVRKISELLTKNGVKNSIVDNSNGPDIIAYTAAGRVAIEYETGRKAISDTIKMLEKRSCEYSKIIVVVNSSAAKSYTVNIPKNIYVISQNEPLKLISIINGGISIQEAFYIY